MNVGDKIKCRAPRGYDLTMGKEYEVIKYEPEAHDINFTWPAYVHVKDDIGEVCVCHAHRFTS